MHFNSKTALYAFGFAALAAGFASCKKDDNNPQPVEQELITTLKLTFLEDVAGATPQSFIYKVENGFNNTSAGTVQADTIRLLPNRNYVVTADVYNEKETPVDTISYEIMEENEAHLFFYLPNPITGAGSVAPIPGTGNLDDGGKPLNMKLQMATGTAGVGSLQMYLIHEPTDKTGTTRADIGGETDAEATFPVRIQ